MLILAQFAPVITWLIKCHVRIVKKKCETNVDLQRASYKRQTSFNDIGLDKVNGLVTEGKSITVKYLQALHDESNIYLSGQSEAAKGEVSLLLGDLTILLLTQFYRDSSKRCKHLQQPSFGVVLNCFQAALVANKLSATILLREKEKRSFIIICYHPKNYHLHQSRENSPSRCCCDSAVLFVRFDNSFWV